MHKIPLRLISTSRFHCTSSPGLRLSFIKKIRVWRDTRIVHQRGCEPTPPPVQKASALHATVAGGGYRTALELLKHSSRIIRRALQCIKNSVAHLESGLESRLLTAVLTVREVFGELIPFAAYTQAPALEGCRFVRISGYISLSHNPGRIVSWSGSPSAGYKSGIPTCYRQSNLLYVCV